MGADISADTVSVFVLTADGGYRDAVEETLGVADTAVRTVDSVADAVAAVDRGAVDCLVTDHHPPDVDGVELLRTVRQLEPDCPVVIYTAHGDESVASAAVAADVSSYLVRDSEADDRLVGVVVGLAADYRQEAAVDWSVKANAMDEAPVGITIADVTQPDDPLVYVNDGYQRITGYAASEALGRNCRFLQGEATDEASTETIRNALAAGESTTVTLRNYRKDGTPFWNRLSLAPITDDAGELTHYVGFQEDITEPVETQRELRRFKRAVEAAGQAILITDLDGTISYVNPAFEEITGYTPDEAVGRTPRLLQSGQHDEAYYGQLWETILGGDVWRDEIVDRRKSGDLYYAFETISPITDDDGDVEEFVAIQTDVTTRKEHERHLTTLDRVLRHDLRNRLNVVLGHAEQLRADADGELVDHAETLVEAASELLEMATHGREINELLLADPAVDAVEILPIVRAAIARLREEYDASTIQLTETCGPDVTVQATPNIGDAVAELLDHRLTHAVDDHPEVTVRLTETEAGVRLEIEDTGEPIPAMEREILSETAEISDLYHGTGLGLWFVYWIVRRSKASITFDSAVDRTLVRIDF